MSEIYVVREAIIYFLSSLGKILSRGTHPTTSNVYLYKYLLTPTQMNDIRR